MKKIILILFIYLLIIPIFCQTIPKPINFSNTDKIISFEWGLNDNNYYTKWIINRPSGDKKEIPFNCTKDSTSLKCIYNTDSTINQLYGTSVLGCINGQAKCDTALNPIYYPTPIITSSISNIPVGGEGLIVNGSFLKFVSSPNFYEIDGTDDLIIFDNDTTKEFNPTSALFKFPSGCGTKSIKLPNGQKIQFSYIKPTIISSELNDDTILLIGNNFCKDEKVKFNGKSIPSSDIKLLSGSRLQVNVSQEYSSTGIPISVGDGSVETNVEFPPIVYSYDPFCGLDGSVTIHGKRLKSQNPNSIISVKVENTNCIVSNSISNSTYLQCHIESGYDKPLIVRIDGLASNSIDFKYEQPIIYNTKIDKTTVIINGFCLSKIKDIKIEGININNNTVPSSTSQTNVTFSLGPKFYGKTDITISDGKNEAKSSITPTLYVKVFQYPNVDDVEVDLDIYYNDPQGSITCNGKSHSTGTGKKDTTYEINPICGPMNLTVSDGTSEYSFQITSNPGKINNCQLLPDGQTLCTGSFLATKENKSPNGTVNFSGKSIPTTFLNSTSFMFTTLDDMSAGDLNLSSCTLSTTATYNLEPMFLSYNADGFSKTGGVASFTGKYFVMNSNHVKIQNCGNNQTVQCTTTSHTNIDCPISINGPKDTTCKITKDDNSTIAIGNQTDGTFIISFSGPLPLASTSAGLEGGSIIIFGKYFYKTNDPFIVTIGNISCDNPTLLDDESNIHCTLGSNPTTNFLTIFDDLQDVNVTLAGKSGIGKIFIYSRKIIPSTTKDNSFNSMYIITAIVILIGLIVTYLQFAYYYKKNRNDFISNYKLIKKQCKKQQYGRPQLQMTESRSQSYANY
ncbi:hypothetical protein ACTFIV_001687 [Dictyostelium citrinum]